MYVCRARDTVRVGELDVDRAPVTNTRYAAFVQATGHRAPAYWPNGVCVKSLLGHPVVGVDFFDALAYALWAGGRLPTEMEWVLASGLTEQRAYVWGDRFNSELCNTVRSGIKGTTRVGSYPPAPSGCVDMIGNVWEMTCSAYPDDDEAIIVKGGSWYDYPGHAKLDTQFGACVQKHGNTIGFRLVYGGAMRLPAFLSNELATQCIEFRQGLHECADEPAAEDDAGEFLDVVLQLREKAKLSLPDLEAESPEIDAQAIDDVLDKFDAVEFEPPKRKPAWAPALYEPDLKERVQAALTSRPRTWLAAACVLAAVLVWWANPGDEGSRLQRPAVADDVARHPLRRVAEPTRVTSPVDGGARERRKHGLPGALQAIESGTPAEREEAELFLIHHPEGARDHVERALRGDLSEAARASLRYVLVALAELESGPAPRPRVVTAPPREGLVLFFESIDADTADEIAKVRRTGLAEGLPVTVVLAGEGSGRTLAKAWRTVLRDVRIYVDRDNTLARLWGASRIPSVACVRKGGRLAFLHVGFMRRSELAEKVAEIKARS